MRLQLKVLFCLISSVLQMNVGQTNDSSYMFKTFGSDGTLVDALSGNSFF